MVPRSTRQPQSAQVISISSSSTRGEIAPVAATATRPERPVSGARSRACDGQARAHTGSRPRPRDAHRVGADFLAPCGRHNTNSRSRQLARRSLHLPLSSP
jgi:hypothetical protein